jgi:hypothetical protein
VIDRRIAHPFGIPSREIPLRGPKRRWVVRTFAADPEHPNRHYDAVHRLGWVPLTLADLAVSVESLGFIVSPAGKIVRGARGEEMLMAMPAEAFAKVQQAKADANLRGLRSTAVQADVAQASGSAFGGEAGDQAYKHFEQREIVEPIG